MDQNYSNQNLPNNQSVQNGSYDFLNDYSEPEKPKKDKKIIIIVVLTVLTLIVFVVGMLLPDNNSPSDNNSVEVVDNASTTADIEALSKFLNSLGNSDHEEAKAFLADSPNKDADYELIWSGFMSYNYDLASCEIQSPELRQRPTRVMCTTKNDVAHKTLLFSVENGLISSVASENK